MTWLLAAARLFSLYAAPPQSNSYHSLIVHDASPNLDGDGTHFGTLAFSGRQAAFSQAAGSV